MDLWGYFGGLFERVISKTRISEFIYEEVVQAPPSDKLLSLHLALVFFLGCPAASVADPKGWSEGEPENALSLFQDFWTLV